MKCALILVLFMCGYCLYAQKKTLDYSSPTEFPFIKFKQISNDGKFLTYELSAPYSETLLILQSTDQLLKTEIPRATESLFTEDSRNLIFTTKGDTLGILDFVKGTTRYIEKVRSFKAPKNGSGEWLAYLSEEPENELVLLSLLKGEEKRYKNVNDYLFSDKGENLLILQNDCNNGHEVLSIESLDDTTTKITLISSRDNISSLTFNDEGSACAFLSGESKNGLEYKSLQYYQVGTDSASSLADFYTPGMEGMSPVTGEIYFNRPGNKLYFKIKKPSVIAPALSSTSVGVNILTYRDEALHPPEEEEPFLAIINLEEKKRVIRLQQNKDHAVNARLFKRENDDFVLLEGETIGGYSDQNWRISSRPNLYLTSTIDGSRKLLKKRIPSSDFSFSPKGKYAIWYNGKENSWICYNIRKEIIINISSAISTKLYINDEVPYLPTPCGIAGWLENDSAVLIYDRHDVWQVDPRGITAPRNITGGYGQKNNTQLRFISFPEDNHFPISLKDTILLSAFDFTSKKSGFFNLTIAGHHSLNQLVMEPRFYYVPGAVNSSCFPSYTMLFYPAKAKNAKVYVISRTSATEFPNLYITKDFKDFKPLTDFAPQEKYNWYRTELVHWKMLDSKPAEGILFKPQNFDPTKKYPVIFFYYEKSADALNVYLRPELSSSSMDIPWFVSHGYLVFLPDIYYKVGSSGWCAYNSVVSAAKYLSKFFWVDGKHMGLHGHSYGGFETNYIVSRTNLFAAAAIAAGTSDVISEYTTPNNFSYYESGQGRIGATLWQRPDLYIENSPILKADKVTTPILIIHNEKDGSVKFIQGQSWYRSLAHLGKKAWMLSYDDEGHTIENENNQLDYSKRLAQFFDHFLKGALPPIWMTKGVPRRLKGIESGLDLDDDDKKSDR